MKVLTWAQRILLFVGGFIALQGFSYFFDYILYPAVMIRFGFWKSLLILYIVAILLNYIGVIIYDLLKKDLFGFEELKKIKEKGESVGNQKLIHRLMKFGDIPVFIFLSWYDPIFAVIYKRKSRNFDGFTKRDYFLLLLSTAIGCIIWSGMWGIGITGIKYLLKHNKLIAGIVVGFVAYPLVQRMYKILKDVFAWFTKRMKKK